MVLYPVQELDRKFIQRIKDATKLKLLEKATNGWKKSPGDFVIREVIFGDSTVTDVYDIEPKTAVTAGIPQWAFDAADLTADDLSSVVKAGEELDDGVWIGFYGYYDLSCEGSELTGAADTPVSSGPITAVEFVRGSSTLDFWKTEHLYGYNEAVGITDTPVIFEENEKIDIKICSTEATEDKFAGLRGYICEPYGRNIAPTLKPELRAMYNVDSVAQLGLEQQKEVVIRGGVDPVQELTPEQISRLYRKVKTTLYRMAVSEGKVSSIREAKEKYIIREFVAGDSSDATDFVDADQVAAVTTGEQNWIQAGSSFTAGDLGNVFASGQKVADNKFVAIIGFADTTPNSSLLEIAPADSSGNLDLWHVQHCYAYRDQVRGYTMRPTYWTQNSPLVLKMCFGVARNHTVKPIMLIMEEYGNVISKT